MKIILCTATVSLVIAASVFTTQKVVQAEARKTRNSIPNVLNNPLGDGESLVSKIDKLNTALASINKRLIRLEESAGRETKVNNAEIKDVTLKVSKDVERLALHVNSLAQEQAALRDVPGQLRIIDANMRAAVNAIDTKTQKSTAPSKDVVKALDWMVQKIDDIDGYFPPLYDFLGAVYDGNATVATDYPSVDQRLNEVILILDKIQKDAAATRKQVTPINIEPTRYPRPFEEREPPVIPK